MKGNNIGNLKFVDKFKFNSEGTSSSSISSCYEVRLDSNRI